jgi:hypothetical protein
MQFFLGASDAHSQVGRAIRFVQRDFTFPISLSGLGGLALQVLALCAIAAIAREEKKV